MVVEGLFPAVPWGCLRFVTVIFPDHTHYFYCISDESLVVEDLWVLSLALKLLHNSLKSIDNCAIEDLYTPDFIQCLVSTASKGTGFSQQWLLKDLEVSVQ